MPSRFVNIQVQRHSLNTDFADFLNTHIVVATGSR